MENTQTILVTILGIFLALFLGLGILVFVKLHGVLADLKKITEKADRIADKAENIGEFFKFTAGPVALGKLLSNISGIVTKHNRSRRSSDE